MIRITYEQEPVENLQLFQEYVDIELCEDSSLTDLFTAMCKVANMATYRCTLEALKKFIKDLEFEGYKDSDRIM